MIRWTSMICVLLAAAGITQFFLHYPNDQPTQKNKIPGSYRSLTAISSARGYGDTTPSGFFKAYEASKGMSKARNAAGKRAANWQNLGPRPFSSGRVLALATDPNDADAVWAGSASGGLWYSATGGQEWERIETGYPVLGVASIAIDPTQPQTMLIGTGEVYGYQNALPGVGDRATRGSYGMGILKSTDRGQTWRMSLDWRYNQLTGVQDIEFVPGRPGHVWAATTEGLYFSTDSGETWERKLEVVMATSVVPLPANPDVVVVACGGFNSPGNGIYRSVDGGDTWVKNGNDLLSGFNGKALLCSDPTNPNRIYVTVGNGFDLIYYTSTDITGPTGSWLMRSDNGGADFTLLDAEYDFASYQGWYSHFPLALPDGQTVLVGGLGPFLYEDGTFRIAQVNRQVSDCHAAHMAPANSQILYLANDKGVIRSDDGGKTWLTVNEGLVISQFYYGMGQSPTERDRVMGTPQDGGGIVHLGNGLWDYFAGHEGGYQLIDPEDPTRTYSGHPHHWGFDALLGEQQFDYHAPEWEDLEAVFWRTAFNAPMVLAPSRPEVLYLARDVVYRSNDRAATWSATNGGQSLDGNPIMVLGISSQDEDLVFAATEPRYGPSHIFRTRDGGQSWVEIGQNLPERHPSSLKVDPTDDQRVLITFSGFGSSHLFESTDGGETWRDLDRGLLPDLPTNVVTIDPDYPQHLYVGNDLGVYVTRDNGNSWENFSEGLPDAVLAYDLMIYQPDRLLRLGTHGNGLYETQLLEPLEAPIGTQLLYPWISNNSGNFESVLIANNLGETAVEVTLTATREHGEQAEVTRTIAAGGFLEESAASLFPSLGSGPGYSVLLEAPGNNLHGRWVTNSLQARSGASPSQGIAVRLSAPDGPTDERMGARLVFPYLPLSESFLSAPVIVNSGEVPTDVVLTLRDAAGGVVATTTLEDLEPRRPYARAITTWAPAGSGAVYLEAASSSAPITGVSFVFNNVFNETAIGNATADAEYPSSSLVYPWISNRDGAYESILVAVNRGTAAVTVDLTARREDGASSSVQRTIPAGGFLAENASTLFPELGSGNGYTVTLEGEGSIFGQWVTHNLQAESGASPSQGVAIRRELTSAPKSGRFGQRVLFGYLPGGAAMTSAPVLVNLGEGTAHINLTFYDGQGNLLLDDQTTLSATQPLRPFARLVSQLLETEGAVQMVASSTEPITGVAFVFNQGFFEPAIGNVQTLP